MSRLAMFVFGSCLACEGSPAAEDTGSEYMDCVGSPGPSDGFADCVVELDSTSPASYGHDSLPEVVLGPPRGGSNLDVASLGCGGSIVLGFAGEGIVDGPGVDLLVFENPFLTATGVFAEPGSVALSQDGDLWSEFPCDAAAETAPGCAGVTPVVSNPENGIDPRDPELAGGDGFDLAQLGLSRAYYLRIRDVSLQHHGDDTWCSGAAAGFDLDAVATVHSE